jgi:hypothetical protein
MDRQRRQVTVTDVIRYVVGLIWIAGAVFNATWTMRHLDLYQGLASDATVPIYRWLFGDVVGARPAFWTVLLVIGELALGLLTLGSGWRARLGLAGGAIWSLLLFPLLWPYTLMMGPYAALLVWLAGRDAGTGVLDAVRGWRAERREREPGRLAHGPRWNAR